MGITISDETTGRELEIDLNTLPMRFNERGPHTNEELNNYEGPLGDVYYRDGEHSIETPAIHTDFEALDADVREELTKVAQEAQQLIDRGETGGGLEVCELLDRAKELLEPELRK